MIANITKGKKAVGALVYDFGPGRRDEHINPRIVAGNVTGTPLQVARAIDHTARQRPEITAPIWRCSLSLPDEDGILPDTQWAAVADKFIAEMGFASAPWVAVRHGDDHIHLTVSRVDWNGQLLTDRWDYRRAREVADVLEEEHGLVRARDRFKAEGPQVRNNELEAANRRRGPDAAVPPEREELRRLVREVRDAAAGLGREAFESGLADAGVDFRANVASTGRMNGYSFSLPRWTDGSGAQIWVPASKVAKDLKWAQLEKVIGELPPTTVDPRVVRTAAARAKSTTVRDVGDDQVAQFADRAAAMLREGQAERGILPEDHPARSSDPAARILEEWRMKQRGEQPPREELPAAGTPVPAWDDKRRRPYGTLATDKLPGEIKKQQRAIEQYTRDQATAQARARHFDAIATGQVTGEHTQELMKLRARLTTAEPFLAVVDKQRAAAQNADTAADAARKLWREADQRKQMGKFELWRLGSNRATEETKASEASKAVHAYTAQAAEARSQASGAWELAQAAAGVRDPEAETRRVTTQWPQLLREAQQRDQAGGRIQRDGALDSATTAATRARQAQARLAALRDEQKLRQSLPPGQRQAEGRARRDAAQEKAAKKAQTARRRGAPRSPRPPDQPWHRRGGGPPPPGGKTHGR
ncbi:relaxase/mobilization nuclease domain-containing protein [Streptomyces xantholiticus]